MYWHLILQPSSVLFCNKNKIKSAWPQLHAPNLKVHPNKLWRTQRVKPCQCSGCNSRQWILYKNSTQALNSGWPSQLFTWMYNSATAISLNLRGARREEGRTGGRILYTRESWTQGTSPWKHRDTDRKADRDTEWNQPTDRLSSTHWHCPCLMSASGDEAHSLQGQKTESGASEEIVWDIWKANIKKRERHDTKQAGWASERQAVQNIQTHKEGERGRDAQREREIDQEKALVAMRVHRKHTWVERAQDVGWTAEVHNIHFKAALLIMHDRGSQSQRSKASTNTSRFTS